VGIYIKVPVIEVVMVDYLACKLRAKDTGDCLPPALNGIDILGW